MPLILAMVVLGCTQPVTTTPSGNGVVLENFTTDFNSVFPGDIFTLSLKYRNNGGYPATNVFAKIDAVSSLIGGVIKTDNVLEKTDYEIFDWRMNVPETAISGERYNPKATLCYSYKTEGYKDLLLIERTWTGEAPTLNTFSSTGPILLTYEATESGIIRGDRTVSFRTIITLSAPGFVGDDTTSEESYGNRDYLTSLKLTIPGTLQEGNNWLIDIEDDNSEVSGIQSSDFDCESISDGNYVCTADVSALKMDDNNRAEARIYLDVSPTRIGEEASYQHIPRVYLEATYKHCQDTETSFPLSIVVK